MLKHVLLFREVKPADGEDEFTCDKCGSIIISDRRFHCPACEGAAAAHRIVANQSLADVDPGDSTDYDLCAACYTSSHLCPSKHALEEVVVPRQSDGLQCAWPAFEVRLRRLRTTASISDCRMFAPGRTDDSRWSGHDSPLWRCPSTASCSQIWTRFTPTRRHPYSSQPMSLASPFRVSMAPHSRSAPRATSQCDADTARMA